ncbi:MAG: hypothetical protein V3U89_06410 [Methylophilaceae bacterium]
MAQSNHSIRLIGFLLLILGYSLLANYTLQSKNYAAIGAFVALVPIFLICLLLAFRSKQRFLMLGLLVLVSPLFWFAWEYFKLHYDWVYWLVHESVQLLLLITFARTLMPGQQPLCTQFAQMAHGSLSPEHTTYSRQVTIAWVLFFAAILLTSNYLFFFYPIKTWSIFVNFAYLPLVTMMFIVEYMVRKWALPEESQTNIMEAVYAFMNKSHNKKNVSR